MSELSKLFSIITNLVLVKVWAHCNVDVELLIDMSQYYHDMPDSMRVCWCSCHEPWFTTIAQTQSEVSC